MDIGGRNIYWEKSMNGLCFMIVIIIIKKEWKYENIIYCCCVCNKNDLRFWFMIYCL